MILTIRYSLHKLMEFSISLSVSRFGIRGTQNEVVVDWKHVTDVAIPPVSTPFPVPKCVKLDCEQGTLYLID